jgi:iron(III) transport system ATP-binding protein
MASLSVERVDKRFGAQRAVADVSLEIEPGEFLAVLGPSGCGKTTLLRLIAGFERADAGRIAFDGQLVSSADYHMPAERRGIGIVFQNYALWPHMSVGRNVAYPLEVRRMERGERDRRVAAALERVGLGGLGERRPRELSGGQRQRVALARCLVMETRLVLLDEPLASHDIHLRASLQDAFADFHRESGAAMLYITHGQAEAMALADRIAVMDEGRILQIAPPETLYREPANEMVARFVGRGGIVPARVTGPPSAGCAPVSLLGYPTVARCRPDQPVGPVQLCIRPEELRPARQGSGLRATVKRTLYQGGSITVELVPEGQPDALLLMNVPAGTTLAAGQATTVTIADAWVVPRG